MSTMDSDRRRQAIRAALMQRAGNSADASAVAEATLHTWNQMVARLTPLIGDRGVDVLFRRALHLTSAAFPWLAIAEKHRDSADMLASFRTRVETSESAAAAEGSHAFLVTFTELLATLLGASLTERLLAPIWTLPPPTSQEEPPS